MAETISGAGITGGPVMFNLPPHVEMMLPPEVRTQVSKRIEAGDMTGAWNLMLLGLLDQMAKEIAEIKQRLIFTTTTGAF